MADVARPINLTTQQKIVKLAKSTGKTYRYLSDQFVEKLGTSRRSEVIAKIGNTKEQKKKILNDYINSL